MSELELIVNERAGRTTPASPKTIWSVGRGSEQIVRIILTGTFDVNYVSQNDHFNLVFDNSIYQ